MTEIEARTLLVDELEKLADGGRFWVPQAQVELFDQVCKAAVAAIQRAASLQPQT